MGVGLGERIGRCGKSERAVKGEGEGVRMIGKGKEWDEDEEKESPGVRRMGGEREERLRRSGKGRV